ncbi:MAG: hypothetical protein PHX02_05030 [Oscillospiraceae bacterium]|nr:hypothetical protein [Oscillospiraceae bacterium]
MTSKGRIKEMFPGGNTYKGFHSFYDYIISLDEANRKYCIKGGPGVGKSSFIKSVATHFLDKGCDVELHHCSSDNNSLDAVVIKQAKVAILDATAPHIVDPKIPGAVDEILNFGEYWNEKGFELQRKTLIDLNKEKKNMFDSCYRCLMCAKQIQDDTETIAEQTVDKAKYSDLVLSIKAQLINNVAFTGMAGKDRHLFHSALTPNGKIDYVDTIITDDLKCYLLKGNHIKGASDILSMVANELLLKGYDVEIYHQPLNPQRLETIVIEKLNFALTLDSKVKDKACKVFDLDNAIISEKLQNKNSLITKNKKMMEMLLDEAYARIKAAKEKHDELEKKYIPQMDFAEVDKLKNKIIKKIESYL